MPLIIGAVALSSLLPQTFSVSLAMISVSFLIIELAAYYAGRLLENPDFFYDHMRRGLTLRA
jgi:hypothetical protein